MAKTITYITLLLIALFTVTGCTKEQSLPVIVEYDFEVVNDDYSAPVRVVIINKTKGADNYEWTFQGGIPASSTNKNPGSILYNEKGEYSVKLIATNRDDSEDEKTITIKIDDPVIIDFEVEILENNFPPVEVKLTNNTTGATSYNWDFNNGIPSFSNLQYPENIVFTEPGEYTITLEVKNDLETHQTQKKIIVNNHILPEFDWLVNFEDDDLQVPVKLSMQNNSISATSYKWTFENGTPMFSENETPEVVFNTPGKHKITLETFNGKESKSISKYIEVYPNTNLRTFTDIKLGVNSSHNNNVNGSFFSTITRQQYSQNGVNDDTGDKIDIIYFGLNSNFTLNKFVSPNDVSSTTFAAIPNATRTKIINSQESCSCSASLTSEEFDAMLDDTLLQNLIIEETDGGSLQFDDTLIPRVILFQNSIRNKGAIKIKEYVQNGADSYILVDIKVQKEEN